MTLVRLRNGQDAWVDQARPSMNLSGTSSVAVKANTAYWYLYLGMEFPRGTVITSAQLRIHARGQSSGNRTITVRAANQNWRPRQLKWNNRPGVTGPATTAVESGILFDGDEIYIDVADLVQQNVNTAANLGWRISTSAANAHRFYAVNSQHPPVLIVTYSIPAATPTDLEPGGDAIGTAKPVLSFTYTDVNDADLSSLQVQISTTKNGTAPDWDSGWVFTSDPELDLSTTGFPGLPSNVTTYWRVRIRDGANQSPTSGWSDWSPLLYRAQGTLTITAPPADELVHDFSPEITWNLAGATQKAWQVRLARATDPSVILYNSGKRTGTDTAHTLPDLAIPDTSSDYIVTVRTWDDVPRTAAPGFPTYVEAAREFTLADDTIPWAPFGLTVDPDPVTPMVTLTWSLARDFTRKFAIARTGRIIAGNLEIDDVRVEENEPPDPDIYRFHDWTVVPLAEARYYVRSVDPNGTSRRTEAVGITTSVRGVWLVDPRTDTWIVCRGNDTGNWDHTDTYGIYTPLGAPPVKITTGQNGLAGSYTGEFYRGDGDRTVREQIAQLKVLRGRPDRTLRLIGGNLNIPVVVADLSHGIHPNMTFDVDRCRVSFKFWQV